MKNFSYFNKPISECSNSELIDWLISFLNGADYTDPHSIEVWDEFELECNNRNDEFNKEVEYIKSVL